MLSRPVDILTRYPIRRSKQQKTAFLEDAQIWFEKQDYPVSVENGKFGSRNLVIGDPQQAKYVVTAHYDTCAKMLFPNLLTPFNSVLFVLWQVFLTAGILLFAMLTGVLLAGATFFAAIHWAPPDSGLMVALVTLLVWYIGFVTSGSMLILSMYFGPANKYNANDNTSGVVTLLEIARTMPENQRHKVCFVLFDLEEKGLWGSKSYRKAYREATDRQLVINLDCVGDGDYIRMFPTKRLKKDRRKLTSLYKACGYFGKKSILVHEKGFGFNPSDHRNFPYGIGICALRKNKFGYYLGRIHTKKDTVLDEINVNILRAAITTYICCDS